MNGIAMNEREIPQISNIIFMYNNDDIGKICNTINRKALIYIFFVVYNC